MFDSFTSETIQVGNGLEIRARIGGDGPPVLLLHGFPQTHVCWRKVAPLLAKTFTVVAADLRGYGASSKPVGGPGHQNYAKRAMAEDQVCLMRKLGFERFQLAGHDRGGRVAHRLALDHPEAVTRLAVLDIAPTAAMYAATSREFAEAYYHWYFLIQPFDLPERLIGGAAEYYLRTTLAAWCKTEGAIEEEAILHYLAAWQSPGAIHAACEDYRAAATIDLEHDAAGERLAMPTLALCGSRGIVGRQFDVLESWRDKSSADVTGTALDCGHFLPEEAPVQTATALQKFFCGT
ncbi:MAG: alpha/beta hydrolase [Hyphomicrobium sp.]|jgi:haloacetate dehalogenase